MSGERWHRQHDKREPKCRRCAASWIGCKVRIKGGSAVRIADMERQADGTWSLITASGMLVSPADVRGECLP